MHNNKEEEGDNLIFGIWDRFKQKYSIITCNYITFDPIDEVIIPYSGCIQRGNRHYSIETKVSLTICSDPLEYMHYHTTGLESTFGNAVEACIRTVYHLN